MNTIENLKEKLLELAEDDSADAKDIKFFLDPISNYINHPTFSQNITDIIEVIVKDRDGNNHFTVADLQYLGQDFQAVTSLVNAIMLLLGAIPNVKLQHNKETTEELIFKILAYVFLVVLPENTSLSLSTDDKKQVIEITMTIYNMIKSSQLVQQLADKIVAWFKSKGLCKCLDSQEKADVVIDRELPRLKMELSSSVNNAREKTLMNSQIKALESLVDKERNKTKKLKKEVRKMQKKTKTESNDEPNEKTNE